MIHERAEPISKYEFTVLFFLMWQCLISHQRAEHIWNENMKSWNTLSIPFVHIDSFEPMFMHIRYRCFQCFNGNKQMFKVPKCKCFTLTMWKSNSEKCPINNKYVTFLSKQKEMSLKKIKHIISLIILSSIFLVYFESIGNTFNSKIERNRMSHKGKFWIYLSSKSKEFAFMKELNIFSKREKSFPTNDFNKQICHRSCKHWNLHLFDKNVLNIYFWAYKNKQCKWQLTNVFWTEWFALFCENFLTLFSIR